MNAKSPITILRDTVPIRPLRYGEALVLAERQAQRFLALQAVTGPAVPERIITELPRLRVARLSPFPTSGATQWSQGRWLVALNGAEPATRQRFSLAHELKHIIDHRFAEVNFSGFPADERAAMVERICDFFAGCLLMPRPWVKSIYCGRIQDLGELAEIFGVSQAAMAVRLSQIGLIEPTPRCLPQGLDWTRSALLEMTDRPTYRRLASAAT